MSKTQSTLLLQGCIFVFSFGGVLTKLAGQHPFLSWSFVLLYGCSLLLFLVYALAWQQFLRRMPLSTAYGNRAVSVVWSMIWGAVFFHEVIGWSMIVGAVLIMLGLYLVNTDG